MRNKQSGFTMQNVAIGIAVASLLITLTVKGRELADASKTQSLAHDFRDLQSALFSYENGLYGRHIPLQQADAGAEAVVRPIEQELADTLNKPFLLWQQTTATDNTELATTGYVPFSPSADVQGHTAAPAPIRGLDKHFIICTDDIPGRLVRQLDTMIDDGDTANGAMRIARGDGDSNAIANQEIDPEGMYLACLGV